MADIAMCRGTNCPKKNNCYRFKATANPYRQSYFSNVPYNFNLKKCKHFWATFNEESSKEKQHDRKES